MSALAIAVRLPRRLPRPPLLIVFYYGWAVLSLLGLWFQFFLLVRHDVIMLRVFTCVVNAGLFRFWLWMARRARGLWEAGYRLRTPTSAEWAMLSVYAALFIVIVVVEMP